MRVTPHSYRDGDAETTEQARNRNLAYWILAAVVVASLVFLAWRRHHRRYAVRRHGAPGLVASTSPSGSAAPVPSGPEAVALVVWIKNPEALTARLMPRLVGPGAPVKAMLPTLGSLLKQGLPQQSQADLDELDLDRPLGYALLSAGDGGSRFVWAAAVRDPVRAVKVVEAYATREGATKERSDALGTDLFRGAKTGRYLGMVGSQVMFASDKAAIEAAAARLRAGYAGATTQATDVVATAPREFITGPFGKMVEKAWIDWSAPQLGGATAGPAKALFDEIASAARSTWTGAEELTLLLDLGEGNAHGTATLRATEGSPFAKFLESYPTTGPDVLLGAPRDALGAMMLQFPPAWLETFRKFLVTPPPGVQIDEALRTKTETVFKQIANVIDGEVLVASVADPPPNGGPGASLLRFRVRDEAGAKKAARDLATFVLQGMPIPPQPLKVDGGDGEVMEFTPAAQPPQPPLPPVGLAWAVRGGNLYVVRGAYPKLRVIRFADGKLENHLGNDADVKTRLARLPGHIAAAMVIAPLRADTPLAAGMGMKPTGQAITVAVEPTPKALVVHVDFDLELTMNVVAPLFLKPVAPPGAPPPGSLPPDAASGVPPAPPGSGAPADKPPKPKPGGGGKPYAPPVIVPPAPTGYVLPLPKHTVD